MKKTALLLFKIKLFFHLLWRLPEKNSGIPRKYQMGRIGWRTAYDVAKEYLNENS